MEKLQGDGFDSQDVVEFLVAPVLYDDNVYKRDESRKLNQVKTKVDSEPHLDELGYPLLQGRHYQGIRREGNIACLRIE